MICARSHSLSSPISGRLSAPPSCCRTRPAAAMAAGTVNIAHRARGRRSESPIQQIPHPPMRPQPPLCAPRTEPRRTRLRIRAQVRHPTDLPNTTNGNSHAYLRTRTPSKIRQEALSRLRTGETRACRSRPRAGPARAPRAHIRNRATRQMAQSRTSWHAARKRYQTHEFQSRYAVARAQRPPLQKM